MFEIVVATKIELPDNLGAIRQKAPLLAQKVECPRVTAINAATRYVRPVEDVKMFLEELLHGLRS